MKRSKDIRQAMYAAVRQRSEQGLPRFNSKRSFAATVGCHPCHRTFLAVWNEMAAKELVIAKDFIYLARPDPTPSEIIQRRKEVQQRWTDKDWIDRRVGIGEGEGTTFELVRRMSRSAA